MVDSCAPNWEKTPNLHDEEDPTLCQLKVYMFYCFVDVKIPLITNVMKYILPIIMSYLSAK